jgi:plastocyanin
MNRAAPAYVATGMNRYASIAGIAVAAIVLASCSSSGGSSPKTAASTASSTAASSAPASSAPGSSAPASSAPAAAAAITISGFKYSGTLTVKAGAKVTVTNKDSVAHTLTDKATHKFDTGNIPGNGGTGTFTAPAKAGTYKFGCTYHPNMAGTLTVTS